MKGYQAMATKRNSRPPLYASGAMVMLGFRVTKAQKEFFLKKWGGGSRFRKMLDHAMATDAGKIKAGNPAMKVQK